MYMYVLACILYTFIRTFPFATNQRTIWWSNRSVDTCHHQFASDYHRIVNTDFFIPQSASFVFSNSQQHPHSSKENIQTNKHTNIHTYTHTSLPMKGNCRTNRGGWNAVELGRPFLESPCCVETRRLHHDTTTTNIKLCTTRHFTNAN